jgi:hypothetical protein
LRTVEERRVLRAPRVELYPLPTAGKVLVEDRKGLLELTSTKHIGVQASTTVGVRAKNAAPENPLQVLQRLNVPTVGLQLE